MGIALVFAGMTCGLLAAVMVWVAFGSILGALLAYSGFGSLSVLLLATAAAFRPEAPSDPFGGGTGD